MIEIENYELIKQKKDILITYSLSDCSALKDVESVNIIAKENKDNTFNLLISNESKEVVTLTGLDKQSLELLKDKRILLAGIDEESNSIAEVSLVKDFKVENQKKLKLG